ncbi:MAG: GNAT family N-acetyltransferase [Burkholderiaceae bacterium]
MPDALPFSSDRLVFRVAGPDDAAALCRLLRDMDEDAMDDAAEAPVSTEAAADVEAVRKTLAAMAGYPDFHAWLALLDGVPVATFSLLIFPGLSHGGASQAVLDAVVVTRALRGKGIGEEMICQAMRLAAEAGCYKLSLSSNLKRQGAHRFYAALGFREHGVSFHISPDVSE